MKIIPFKERSSWLDPWSEMEDLPGEINRLFDLRFKNGEKARMSMPAVDITEEKDKIVVKADIPGMTKDQIQVSADDGVLTIKGEKKEEKEIKEKGYIRLERFSGAFERSFTLPAGVDVGAVKASYKDGVLMINLPKKEDAKSKKVSVKIE